VPQAQHDLGVELQEAGSEMPLPVPAEAKTENFFVRRVDPHFGQIVRSRVERTSISLSVAHFSQ
jgi:hypothetical protein